LRIFFVAVIYFCLYLLLSLLHTYDDERQSR
jgi:preprotein translocase subunit SecG